jgi:hypothetical protein
MRVHVAREHGARLEEALAVLLAAEPYLAYANFPPIARREGSLLALHLRRWHAAAADCGVLVARDQHDHPLAALGLQHREFESHHFGMGMAKLEPPAAVAEEHLRAAALRALYPAAGQMLRESGYHHLSAATSTHDRIASWILQEIGGFYVGTRISWMQPLTGRRPEQPLPAHLRIESYDKSNVGTLDPASWRRLYDWSGQAFDRGPYVFDLHVPRGRAMAIYQVWTEKALAGEWADFLLVIRDGDQIVAFHSMMRLADLSEAAGVGIVGRGIGGTLPGYRGLFTALQKECSAVRPLGASFLENETQASTVQSINVFGKLGHHCLRSTASFHLRLRGGPGDGTTSGRPSRDS